MGRRQRIRRTQSGTWNPKPHNLKPRSGGCVAVKVETTDVGAERGPAAIGSDSCRALVAALGFFLSKKKKQKKVANSD